MRLIDADALEFPTMYSVRDQMEMTKMIEDAPTVATCEDTISRQAAIDALDCINGVEAVLRSLPTIQPEPKEGYWILYDKRFPWRTWYKCSGCGNYLDFSGVNGGRGEVNFCPNCGAKMTISTR